MTTDSVEVRLARLEEQRTADSNAVRLQAQEYMRRLDELNHAAAKKELEQSRYISDDRFNGYVEKIDSWRGRIDAAMAQMQGRGSGSNFVQETVLKVLPMLIAAGALVALIWQMTGG